jgi:hypothetical protein
MKVSLAVSISLLSLAAGCTGRALKLDRNIENVAPIIEELQRSVKEEKDFPDNCVRQASLAAPDRLNRLQKLGVPISKLNFLVFVSSDEFLETALVVLYKKDGLWSLMSDSADATLRKHISADEAEEISERIRMASRGSLHDSSRQHPFNAQDHGQCATIIFLSNEEMIASSYATSAPSDDDEAVFELLEDLDAILVGDGARS